MINRCGTCGAMYSTREEFQNHNCEYKVICGNCKTELGWFHNYSLCTYCGAEGEKLVKQTVKVEEEEEED